ncbi:Chaoptin [Cryptotermes secundus]|uniref:Chaoptin n=1 Tax=Cryptotermes secundus TaxID=105785 RepID=A0A2J7PT71_9NEOP|nr:Chaoptin [Cryptotermes secundus]
MPQTSFHFLKCLRVLKLQDNQIDAIHKGTIQGGIHAGLEALYLSFNSLEFLNIHTFMDLPSLELLQLDDNRIKRIERHAFMNMDVLKKLDLRGNKLMAISDEAFQNLPQLELLDLAYNQLQSLDFSMLDQVGTLSSFHLNVSHNALQQLELNATRGRGGEMSANVKMLDLSYNNVTCIGHSYLRPVEQSLTHLHLSHNRLINTTREVFGNMPHLQWLDLSSNQLAELDFDTFRNTKMMQVLLLTHNQLSSIPTQLFRPTSGLRVVDMSHNKLRSLPDTLFTQSGLEQLILSHNLLSHVPVSSLGAATAATLCELNLSWNSIVEVSSPDVFSRFKSLMWLDMSHNRLLRIKDSTFLFVSRLSFLDLSHNSQMVLETRGRSFKGLEDSLLELHLCNTSLGSMPELLLPALRTLRLAQNRIQDVPVEVARSLTSLQQLDVSYNQLQAVPPAARSMPHLRCLELAGNPITTLSNTSFQGAMEHLQELDIRHLTLNYFQPSALSRMASLRTLSLSPYDHVHDYSVPEIIQQNTGLRNLHIQVLENTDLEKEMLGPLPYKVRNITLSGRGLTSVPHSLFKLG